MKNNYNQMLDLLILVHIGVGNFRTGMFFTMTETVFTILSETGFRQ